MNNLLSRQRLKKMIRVYLCLITIAGGLYWFGNPDHQSLFLAQAPGLQIAAITTNIAEYPNDKIPKYEKFELTFQVENSVAGNYQFPYDPNPPNGIDLTYPKHQGINVDALFLPPGGTDWDEAYQQPAFYYKHFDDQIKKDGSGIDREWYYPTGEFSWKARFSPDKPGLWKYKLKAQDASGYAETLPQSFVVVNSSNEGFVKVSNTDPRYFEFDNGTFFYGAGFNYGPPLDYPVLKSEPDFQVFQQNRINLLRVWISNMYGTAWMHYVGGRNMYDGYLPRPGILPFYDTANDRTTMTMYLDYEPEGDTGWFDGCRFRFWLDFEAVKPHTNYRLRIKYRGFDMAGPRDPAYPDYGFVAKFSDWSPDCYEPGTGTVITNYGSNNSGWQYIEGVWNSGNNNFLPTLHMALENVIEGQVYVDSISVQEQLGDGQYGSEIMVEPSMEYELYFSQKEAYAFDKMVELAEQYDIYLKLVIMDKNEKIYYKIDNNGDFIVEGDDNVDGFYGTGRTVNKTRWLQQAWWRYLQARWGYSSHIHSWELTNEGDPWNSNHYALTDELGKFMHCQAFDIPVGDGERCKYDHPNDHLVTTSFWHSFPAVSFWANPNYPNVDYADLHQYIPEDADPDFYDAALATFDVSMQYGAKRPGGASKPVIRGETGFTITATDPPHPELQNDTTGVWLHNYLWGGINPGGLTEIYWYRDAHIVSESIDHTPIYKTFYNFIKDVPLNNGNYEDAQASTTTNKLRVWGQKDLINQRAHLWIQNKSHTWKNVVDGVSITPVSGTVTISGFQKNRDYMLQWWDTYETQPKQAVKRSETITVQPNGDIRLQISDLRSDIAVKISLMAGPPN